MNPFLSVQGVNKWFSVSADVTVCGVKNISLTIDQGEFVVLSGPSGSGKTTLLNLIGGLEAVDQGQVVLDGLVLTELVEKQLAKVRRDHIGFVFQAYNLIPVLTAAENIGYVMCLQNCPAEVQQARIQALAKKLDIEGLLTKRPNQLSGGQQQRVAVARAVASTPKLLLADEPTANLDSHSAAELMDLMLRLNQEEGVTIIFSSHDPMVIEKARHSVVLKDGEIIENKRLDLAAVA